MNSILTRTRLALAILAVAAAPAFAQGTALQRYESGAHVQHASAPQKTQVLAQAEGTRGGNAMYGRNYAAAEQTGVVNRSPVPGRLR